MRGHGIAGNQPTTADGDDKRVQRGLVLQHLQRDCALPRDHLLIVIRMHPDKVALTRELSRARMRLENGLPVEDHGSAMGLSRGHFHEGRGHRHHDGGGNAKPRGVIGYRLRMIAGGHGDDTAPPLVVGQRIELVQSAPLLEGIGDLQVFVFDENRRAGKRRKQGRRQHGRAQHLPREHAAGRLDIGKGYAHQSLRSATIPAPMRAYH